MSPQNVSSAVYNGLLIAVFSIVSLGLVLVESKVLFQMGFPPTPKTVSFVIPSKGQYRLGEIFPMKIEIVGIETPINAVQADVGFDPTRLEVIDLDTNGSFANIFIQKEINNEAGYARLTGGLPNPGFFDEKGVFGTVFFKSKTPGIVKIEFLPTTMVLANDTHGTNVLKELSSVSYLILPETISEEEEELQKEMKFKSKILGESTISSQLQLYEERDVLGAQVEREINKEQSFDIFRWSLSILEKIDHFILSQWSNLFGIFAKNKN